MDWESFTIDPIGLDTATLLSDWRWLVPTDLRPVGLTLFGDWFFEDEHHRVHFLDTVGGQLTEIAPTVEAFLIARQESDSLDEWYMADLALRCLERGLQPGRGQCLGFKLPPVLGGALDPENVEVCDLAVHESITAQIHRRVKDLPEGTTIERFALKD